MHNLLFFLLVNFYLFTKVFPHTQWFYSLTYLRNESEFLIKKKSEIMLLLYVTFLGRPCMLVEAIIDFHTQMVLKIIFDIMKINNLFIYFVVFVGEFLQKSADT